MHCPVWTRQNTSENCEKGCTVPIRKPQKRLASVQPIKNNTTISMLILRCCILAIASSAKCWTPRKQRLADRWESQPYVVCRQPNEDIPVYVVKPDKTRSGKRRTLHRNLLLPFMSIFDWHTQEEDLLNAVEESQVNELDTD